MKAKEIERDMTFRPDWTRPCITCGAKPIMPATEMCGVCTFGEAAMANGAWWDEDRAAAFAREAAAILASPIPDNHSTAGGEG